MFIARPNDQLVLAKSSTFSLFSPLRDHAKMCTLPIADPIYQAKYKSDLNRFRQFWSENPTCETQKAYSMEEKCIQTADGARLSVLCFRHQRATPDTRTVLLFNPNSATSAEMPYHWLMEEIASRSTPCNFVTYDYREAGGSTGDLVDTGDFLLDADAMLQFIEETFKTERNKIALYGWSLGGAIAANAAELQPGSMAPAILERTFSTSSKVMFKGLSILEKVGQFSLSQILRSIRWELDTTSGTKKMLDAGRPVLVIHHPLDPIMMNAASLFASVEGHPALSSLALGEEGDDPAPAWVNHHLTPLNWYPIGENTTAAKIAADFLLR